MGRCHPALSAIPNAHFYQGRLLDGCQADDRPALVPGLGPLSFEDVRGHESRTGHSLSNAAEASRVQRALQHLAAQGVDPCRMGVICFFRAQVWIDGVCCGLASNAGGSNPGAGFDAVTLAVFRCWLAACSALPCLLVCCRTATC